jgi:hypothetical protein
MADDRERDGQWRVVSRKRGQEVESYDGKNPPTGFAQGPGSYDLIPQIIGTFGLRPGWSYIDSGISDQRPSDPLGLRADGPKSRKVDMGVTIPVMTKIVEYLKSARAVNHAWRDAVDRTLQNKDFALLVSNVSLPMTLRECLQLWPRYVRPPGSEWDIERDLDDHAGHDWQSVHGVAPDVYDPDDPADVQRNRDRYYELKGKDWAESRLLEEPRPVTAAAVTAEWIPKPPDVENEFSLKFYATTYKLLDEDVFLRQYLGLTEADMQELNRDLKARGENVPERAAPPPPPADSNK